MTDIQFTTLISTLFAIGSFLVPDVEYSGIKRILLVVFAIIWAIL